MIYFLYWSVLDDAADDDDDDDDYDDVERNSLTSFQSTWHRNVFGII